jgi:hypothetical protein
MYSPFVMSLRLRRNLALTLCNVQKGVRRVLVTGSRAHMLLHCLNVCVIVSVGKRCLDCCVQLLHHQRLRIEHRRRKASASRRLDRLRKIVLRFLLFLNDVLLESRPPQ